MRGRNELQVTVRQLNSVSSRRTAMTAVSRLRIKETKRTRSATRASQKERVLEAATAAEAEINNGDLCIYVCVLFT